MRSAVLSVLYPAAVPFFGDFLGSLEKQTDQDFELLLVNDGVPETHEFLKDRKLLSAVVPGSGSPVRLRKRGISEAVRRSYEAIIFADADDWFAPNRIEVSKQMLCGHALVFNDLIFAGNRISERSMFGDRLSEGQALSLEDLIEGNCLGLSNTAIKTSVIKNAHESVPDPLSVFDWPFFLRVLAGGTKAFFTRKTHSYYRQDAARSSPYAIDRKLIERGTRVKKEVYASLADLGEPFKTLSEEFRDLKTEGVVLKNPFWWEFIKRGTTVHDKNR